MTPTADIRGRNRPRLSLIAGMLAGVVLAGGPLVRMEDSPAAPIPEGAVAVVNGVTIQEAEYQRALSALEQDSGSAVKDEDARYALTRLIEQELLVQRALQLGFLEQDRTVRNTLVTAMVQTILASVQGAAFSESELRAFYENNGDYFTRTGRLHVREIRVPVTPDLPEQTALERAESAAARLRLGEPIDIVSHELGSDPVAPVPDGLIPPVQLRNYLGPTPAEVAITLQPGQVSEPIRGGSAYHVLQMVDREPGVRPPFEEVESLVRVEMQRRNGDQAIREYLNRLSENADIRRFDE